MDQKIWLQYCATEEQLRQFNDEGYLIVEDALSPEMLDRLNEAADRVEAEERKAKGLKPDDMLMKFRTVVEDDTFLDLLDNPKTFPLLWDILGWNIQLYISHLIVYPPEQKGGEIRKSGPIGALGPLLPAWFHAAASRWISAFSSQHSAIS